MGSRPSTAPRGAIRSFDHRDFDVSALVAARAGRRVAVCLPARDEAHTLGAIVSSVRRALTPWEGGADLVDDIVVVDDGSTDDTAAVGRRAGGVCHRGPDRGAGERAKP